MQVEIMLQEGASEPKRATKGSAARDVHAFLPEQPLLLYPGRTERVPTGLHYRIPLGTGLFILPRSGLASKGIVVANAPGLLDSDYRDELGILLRNTTNDVFTIPHGMRVAQILILEVPDYDTVVVSQFGEEDLERKGGFGSTGH